MARVKYNGTNKARVSWNSMGKAYSYNVLPGQTISVPDDQVNNISACGPFVVISSPNKNKKPVINKKKIDVPVETESLKVVKPIFNDESDTEVKNEDVPEEKEDENVEDFEDNIEIIDGGVEEVEENDDIKIDYTSFRKEELKEMCKERGLIVSGNRDDLITRLCNYDNGVVLD